VLLTRLGGRAVISPQNPVVIPPMSEPLPDLCLLRPRTVSYSHELPGSQDVQLVIEVSEADTVQVDRLVKGPLYARAGIAEFWLLFPAEGTVEVHREPGGDGYANVTRCGPGETVAPLAFPDVAFTVTDFFG
jgi:Uma2 family endonuclease